MKKILLGLLFISVLFAKAQNLLIKERIKILETTGTEFKSFDLFTKTGDKQTAQLGAYTAVNLNRTGLHDLYTSKPEQLTFALPYQGNIWPLQFTKAHILDSTKFMIANGTAEYVDNSYKPGVFYHGIIKGVAGNSFVTASVFENYISIFIAYEGANIQCGQTDEKAINSNDYGVFGKLPGNNDPMPFTCGTNPVLSTNVLAGMQATSPNGNRIEVYSGRVPRIFFDCAFAYYQHYSSSTTACFNKITTLFNQTALCYANENINTGISQIRVWTSTDPYTHDTRDNGLATFKNYVRNGYTGNIAMLCDWQSGNSGLADGIGTICQAWSSTIDGPYIYNDMNYNNYYYNFPVAADAPDTYLMIHEMGHILGSAHTQSCNWPGGAIDNCAATEGGCAGGPTPVRGTMMSYCCTSLIGVDFNYGFGPLPGNAIRNHINAVSCLVNGTTVCDSTLYLQGGISNTDYTRFQVSNTITSENVLSSSANVLFDAGRKIDLKDGFRAPQGVVFRAVIEGCGGLYKQGVTSIPVK